VLTRLDLEHFKCFDLLKLPIGRLTFLSGSNASGKSSVLQSLVLLHQTIREQEWSTRLLLNGGELRLGTITDVVDKLTGRRTFGIGLIDSNCETRWTFEGADRRDMSAVVTAVRVGNTEQLAPAALRFLLPPSAPPEQEDLATRLLRLCFLTAERIGPREVYPLEDPNATQVVGPRGENAASLLHWGRDQAVLDTLAINDRPPTLFHQVEAYMQEFFPGCSLEVQQVPQSNGVTLGLRTSSATDFHRPVHVGFGLTQVFPIIVAALSRKANDLLLIENPEVHLHPAGQARMGEFLSKIAAAGIQVLIETHSDHVLNGIRRSVKGGVTKHEEVAIHFFKDRETKGDQIISPLIDANGNIDVWPSGFFDQFDKDMNYFAGWGS
jgi:predicted ATPase